MMNHEDGIECGHGEVGHMPTVPCQGMYRIVNTLQVIVILSAVLQDRVGKDGVVGFGGEKLVGIRTEPWGFFKSFNISSCKKRKKNTYI